MRSALTFITLLCLCSTSLAQFNPEQIQIMRDKWGVPHIYAPTDAQTSYGLAWAHAEDDFETIQLSILAAKGMLGLHLGKDGAPIDYVSHLLRCKEIVKDHINDVSPEFMKVVAGYVAGLNSYAENHPKEVLVKKAFPVTVEEAFETYVFQLAIFDGADDVISDIFGNRIKPYFKGTGSNAIAVRRHKTKEDEVFLAVNAHQPLEGPVGWYEAHLMSDEGWNMLGGLFPGGPVVFHGTNENLGWAHTVNYPDKIDVFQLQMKDDESEEYHIKELGYFPLEKRKAKLKVKLFLGLKIGVKRDVYYSPHYGPVMKNDSGYFAFNMGVFHEIRAVEQWYNMNKASNLDDFKAALEMTAIPSFNIMYADREDNIFYVSNGKIPFRNPNYDWMKLLPGNTEETVPKAYHPFEDFPMYENPSSGYLFNTNNTPFNATESNENLNWSDYDSTMGFVLRENNRSLRFMHLMSQYDQLNYNDFKRIKFDVKLPDSLAYRLNVNKAFSLTFEGKAKEIQDILNAWDREGEVDRVGAAHMKIFYQKYARLYYSNKRKEPIDEDFQKALEETHDYFMQHFNKIDVQLGEFQKLVRGDVELPLRGMPDVLASMSTRAHENGKVKGYSGESYILLARYPKEGMPIIETIHAYGNSSKPESLHYTDQMEDFTKLKMKPMSLDLEDARKNAVRTYSPK